LAASPFYFHVTISAIIALQDSALLLALDSQAVCKGWGKGSPPCRKLHASIASAFPLVGYYRIILPDFFQSDGAETSSLTPEKEDFLPKIL
jgi:hypothetical protein